MDSNSDDKINEALIREFSESMKGLKAPEGLRESNRRYIRNALCGANSKREKKPGWLRKRISVPFPAAAGFLLIFCIQLALAFFNLSDHFKVSESPLPGTTNSIGLLEERVQPRYSERNVYVAGIGFVETVKDFAYIKERNYESN